MKSLEDEALRAQAVITKAQERSMTTEEAKVKANTMSAVDIAFAGVYYGLLWLWGHNHIAWCCKDCI